MYAVPRELRHTEKTNNTAVYRSSWTFTRAQPRCGETGSAASRRPKVGERIHPPRGISIGDSIDALDRAVGSPGDRTNASSYILSDAQGKPASRPGVNLRLEIGSSFTDVGILKTSR